MQQALVRLLTDVVDEGASIGFLAPLQPEEAAAYWSNVLEDAVMLWIASVDRNVAGSIQLHLARKANAVHRAEVAKLMVHSAYRRMGIGERLMAEAERAARLEGRQLLVLDTREGDPSNLLYRKIGYTEAGRIPSFAQSSNGQLDGTVIYYKLLNHA